MTSHRLVVALVGLNAVLAAALMDRQGRASAAVVPDVLRAKAIELVDGEGRVRAQINVEANGETVLRLRDSAGEVRVKLGAGKDGSGLLLANGATAPGIHMIAQRTATLTLRNEDGSERVVEP
jgi:hypothetical protein